MHAALRFRALHGQGAAAQGAGGDGPVSGQSLSREELSERLEPFKRQSGLVDDYDVPLGLYLQAAMPRDIIARMLRNLKEVHRTQQDWQRLISVQDRLIVLLPQAWGEWRDRGLAHAERGNVAQAVSDLQTYLAQHRGGRTSLFHFNSRAPAFLGLCQASCWPPGQCLRVHDQHRCSWRRLAMPSMPLSSAAPAFGAGRLAISYATRMVMCGVSLIGLNGGPTGLVAHAVSEAARVGPRCGW
jgi:hypothetical protein